MTNVETKFLCAAAISLNVEVRCFMVQSPCCLTRAMTTFRIKN